MKLKTLLALPLASLLVSATPVWATTTKWECRANLADSSFVFRPITAATRQEATKAFMTFLEDLDARGIIDIDGAGIDCTPS